MRLQVGIAAGLALLVTIPFIDQAFHVDDPNFLALAAHAWPHPLRLYDFLINWGGTDERAFDILANPPLVPWYLAVLGSLARGREWVYHLGFWPFLPAVLAGMWRLGRRFGGGARAGLWALLWAGVSPAVVLASHTVMPDLPLLAGYVLGMALAIDGLDRGRTGLAATGGLLAGLSALCRYSGMTAIPLLLLYVLLHRPARRAAAAALLAVVAPLALWTVASLTVYGRVHWLTIAGFEGQTLEQGALVHKLAYQLTALGLAVGPAGVLACALSLVGARDLRRLGARAAPVNAGAEPSSGGNSGDDAREGRAGEQARFRESGEQARSVERRAGGAGAGLGGVMGAALAWQEALAWYNAMLLVAGLAGGGLVLGGALAALPAVAKGRLWRGRGGLEADGLFLACWLLGVLTFNLWLLFASVRYLLPLMAPTVLLLQRLCPPRPGPGARPALATVTVLLLSLALSRADQSFAEGYRSYVATLPPSDHTRWFTGHWGMQYYLERSGARPLSSTDVRGPGPGDEVIVPTYAWPQDLPPGVKLRSIQRTEVRAGAGLRTFTVAGRACFYADMLAPGPVPVLLPFAFDNGPLETLSRGVIAP